MKRHPSEITNDINAAATTAPYRVSADLWGELHSALADVSGVDPWATLAVRSARNLAQIEEALDRGCARCGALRHVESLVVMTGDGVSVRCENQARCATRCASGAIDAA